MKFVKNFSQQIAFILIFAASLLAMMCGSTIEHKVLASIIGSATIGLLGAIVLQFESFNNRPDWKQLSDNVSEAQRIINQNPTIAVRRQLLGLKEQNSNLDIQETISSLPAILFLLMLGLVFGLDQNILSYVLNLHLPVPPEPKVILLYLGMLFCLSSSFLGLFLAIIRYIRKAKSDLN